MGKIERKCVITNVCGAVWGCVVFTGSEDDLSTLTESYHTRGLNTNFSRRKKTGLNRSKNAVYHYKEIIENNSDDFDIFVSIVGLCGNLNVFSLF